MVSNELMVNMCVSIYILHWGVQIVGSVKMIESLEREWHRSLVDFIKVPLFYEAVEVGSEKKLQQKCRVNLFTTLH